MAAQMSDAHRRFLQILMSHGIMEGAEARKLHRRCCEISKGGSFFWKEMWGDGGTLLFFIMQLVNHYISEKCMLAK